MRVVSTRVTHERTSAPDEQVDAVALAVQLDLRLVGAAAALEHVMELRPRGAVGAERGDRLGERAVRRARCNVAEEVTADRAPALDAARLGFGPVHAEDAVTVAEAHDAVRQGIECGIVEFVEHLHVRWRQEPPQTLHCPPCQIDGSSYFARGCGPASPMRTALTPSASTSARSRCRALSRPRTSSRTMASASPASSGQVRTSSPRGATCRCIAKPSSRAAATTTAYIDSTSATSRVPRASTARPGPRARTCGRSRSPGSIASRAAISTRCSRSTPTTPPTHRRRSACATPRRAACCAARRRCARGGKTASLACRRCATSRPRSPPTRGACSWSTCATSRASPTIRSPRRSSARTARSSRAACSMADSLGDWLSARPFARALSSGCFWFFAHTGMLSSLVRRGLLPRVVAGSSAGALVGGAWAAGLPPDALADRLHRLERREFWDPAPGAGLLAGERFDNLLRDLMPVHDAAGCRVPVKISVFDIARRTTAVLADGDLAHAIRASCAVPALFHPVRIAGRAYWDGGILDRPGLAGLAGDDRVLFHHIASKSPWRRSLDVPRRPGMVTLVIDELPRSGPFRLDAGRRALLLARDAMARALDAPIIDGIVRVRAPAACRACPSAHVA